MPSRIQIERIVRLARHGLRSLLDQDHPILVHLIPIRRCNLSCAYCNEYDAVSSPVPVEVLLRRVDLLAGLGTSAVTLSGGEPLLHPELEAVVNRARGHGMFITLITNGYMLSPERIAELGRAGLDHLQISIDNVEPDGVSLKSLRLLEPKLAWLAEHAGFSVAINSVLGAGVKNPGDALTVARRAKELGFQSSVGVIHDGHGQLRPLNGYEKGIYDQIKALHGWRPVRVNRSFQNNLAQGRPNAWRCRAGARYLYVDEDGLVSYCSQQRGRPGIPLERYTKDDIRREYLTEKPCAPYCTVNCVQQVALADSWRAPQRPASPLPAEGQVPALSGTGDVPLAP
jgi:MoaA/NifB/PqqE/SkfB family radical SAM enzyme